MFEDIPKRNMNETNQIVKIRINAPNNFLPCVKWRWFQEVSCFLTFISWLLTPSSSLLAFKMVWNWIVWIYNRLLQGNCSFAGQNDSVWGNMTLHQLFHLGHLIIYLLKHWQFTSICPAREQYCSYREVVQY